jgi:asparagine synthase (glutamine-hydrolysing)
VIIVIKKDIIMCGIAGLVQSVSNKVDRTEILQKWSTLLHHRGPDSEGCYFNEIETVLLFHRRLSITGLNNGKQPICNEDQRLWLTFNGEIYQYEQLRQQLISKGHQFATETDTEVILHLYEEEGIDCLKHLRGEFAFALYDSNTNKIFLVRDRFGIKPLFYFAPQQGGILVFSSEIKGVFAHPDVPRRFSSDGIQDFFQSFYFSDQTIFEDIQQVPPASYLEFDILQSKVKINKYWQIPFGQQTLNIPEEDAVAQFLEILETSISIRLPKEVPVGAFLSGGLDSSSIVRLMAKLKPAGFPVFSIGFKDPAYDELTQAQTLARQLGLQHETLSFMDGDLKEAFVRFIWHAEIPVLNTHGAAKYLLSHLAHQHCKVVLTGEGADEALLGYEAFAHLQLLENEEKKRSAYDQRKAISRGAIWANKLPEEKNVRAVFGAYPYPMVRYFKLRRLGQLLLSKEWSSKIKKYDWEAKVSQHFSIKQFGGLSGLEATQLFLFQSDLPAYILNSLGDRPEMANSLEGRPPFLDHKLVEFACQLPENLKLRNGTGKYILREAMKGLLDDETRLRPKKVFYAPSLSSLKFQEDYSFFHKFVHREKFKEVGIFSFNTFQSLKFALKVIPAHHKYYPIMESALVMVLSVHILHDMFIGNFDKYMDSFSQKV